jgi:hypothetical protein
MNAMTFTSDELLLALVSLVRATRPAMLHQEADGFTVDFEAIAASKTLDASDRLLLKLGAAMQSPPPNAAANEAKGAGNNLAPAGGLSEKPSEKENADGLLSLDLSAAEARQIADALAQLELLQAWPQDVLRMSRALRSHLVASSASPRAGGN